MVIIVKLEVLQSMLSLRMVANLPSSIEVDDQAFLQYGSMGFDGPIVSIFRSVKFRRKGTFSQFPEKETSHCITLPYCMHAWLGIFL